MTPEEISKYYVYPLDPTRFPDSEGITSDQIKEHTEALQKAIEKLCIDFAKSQKNEMLKTMLNNNTLDKENYNYYYQKFVNS